MEEIITYKAFDGTSFQNKAECIRYEENLNESLKLKKEIQSYVKQNHNIILEFLALVKCYCMTLSLSCKGCLFAEAENDQCCAISDMDIKELEKIIKEIIEECDKE